MACVISPGYLDTLRKTRPANSRWKILVVDAFTKKHMNHVMKVYDILEEGVQRESHCCCRQTLARQPRQAVLRQRDQDIQLSKCIIVLTGR